MYLYFFESQLTLLIDLIRIFVVTTVEVSIGI